MSEENPSREDDQHQQDSYLDHLPGTVSLGFDVAAYPDSYSNSPPPLDPNDPTISSVAPTAAPFSQILPHSRRRPAGQFPPLPTPPRVRSPSNTRSFLSRNNSQQEQGLDWNEFRRTCYKVASFDEMARDKDAPEISESSALERNTAFSNASMLYAKWHTTWSKPQELDGVIISAISNCMTEPTKEQFSLKCDEVKMKVESATELISKLPPPSTTEPEGDFF
ncbi:hypothetical protein I350_07795 [Cryptococcus amylolentus CBS 6273]|uniref:Uncharacterized protein n=1 Tax=Cryptococcus amylolentus CBS 6273 TaxID=1296118 RepID=A0A1E3JBD2_9TREE|nr:hypothetical protein I350_07795 [Cryptococcus amylolentus CBS 6273]